MKIGLFYQIQVPKPWTATSESDRIYEALEQIPYAEAMGFESAWFSEHHFRPVWSHNSAPDLTLAAVSQRTNRIRLGVGVVLATIHHPLHVAARMATLDILSRGRVDVGLGRTGYPYQLTPYGTDLGDTRGMWQEFIEVLPRIWTEREIEYSGKYYRIPRREVLPKPVQRPHPPLWSACSSDETARQTGRSGMGGLFGSEGGPDRVEQLPNPVGAPLAAEQAAHTRSSGLARRLVAAAGGPERRMRALDRLGQHLAARDPVIFAGILDFPLGPDARQHLDKLLPHAARVAQIGAIRGELIGITGPSQPDIDPPAAQNVERCHAGGDVQRVMDRRQHHPDTETDPVGSLADRRQGQIRRAVV